MNDNDAANDVTTEYKAEALRIGEEEGVEVIVVQSLRIIALHIRRRCHWAGGWRLR